MKVCLTAENLLPHLRGDANWKTPCFRKESSLRKCCALPVRGYLKSHGSIPGRASYESEWNSQMAWRGYGGRWQQVYSECEGAQPSNGIEGVAMMSELKPAPGNKDSSLPFEEKEAREEHKAVLRLVRNGQVAEARSSLERLVLKYPTNVYILTTAGVFESRNHRKEKARQIFRRGAELHPKNAPIRQAWAVMEASRGPAGAAKARQLFRQATEVDPSHAASWQAWAHFEDHSMKDIRVARQLYRKAAQVAPSHAPTWQAWAGLEERNGRIERARELYRKSVEVDECHAHSWLAWAIMEWKERNIDTARNLFQQGAIIPGHRSGAILQVWATFESENGDARLARELYGQAAERDPKMGQTWLQWSTFERCQGDLLEARAILRLGAASCPNNVHILHALALLEKDTGNLEESRKVLARAQEVDPGNARVSAAMAGVEAMRGRLADARSLAREALMASQCDQSASALYVKLADVEELSRQPNLARKMYEAAARATPGNGRLLRSWAIFESRQARLTEASELFRQSAEAGPHDPRTWLLWSLWELRIGNIPKCQAVFDRGLELNPRSQFLYLAWARLEARLGNKAAAMELLEAGCAACPGYAPLWLDLAAMQESVAESKRVLEEASQKALDCPPLFKRLAEVEASAGNQALAAELAATADRIRQHPLNVVPKCIDKTLCGRVRRRKWVGWEASEMSRS